MSDPDQKKYISLLHMINRPPSQPKMLSRAWYGHANLTIRFNVLDPKDFFCCQQTNFLHNCCGSGIHLRIQSPCYSWIYTMFYLYCQTFVSDCQHLANTHSPFVSVFRICQTLPPLLTADIICEQSIISYVKKLEF